MSDGGQAKTAQRQPAMNMTVEPDEHDSEPLQSFTVADIAADSPSFAYAEHGAADEERGNIQDAHLEIILDVPLTLSVEIGRARLTIRDLLQLSPGSVVKLDRRAGDPMDIMVNGCLIAKGEVVVAGETFGIRITAVVSPEDRIKSLR
jgi:flagellar motor switch protein FliN/FliY